MKHFHYIIHVVILAQDQVIFQMSHHDEGHFQKRYKITVLSIKSPNINGFWFLNKLWIHGGKCQHIKAFNG